jgi:ribosomal protein L37E
VTKVLTSKTTTTTTSCSRCGSSFSTFEVLTAVCGQAGIGRARGLHQEIETECKTSGHGAVQAKMHAERPGRTVVNVVAGEAGHGH